MPRNYKPTDRRTEAVARSPRGDFRDEQCRCWRWDLPHVHTLREHILLTYPLRKATAT